ncbi:MAG TPA: patatin-like phospholipase family protein [Candidatus Eisenbacteria bacterium]|nr:patatin-like phospholipase family protein [Candidatus Eisenbacteria bacterium]
MRLAAVLALAILVHSGSARAEDALVLSGGGSRGLAHAGALVGLEQRGYDPGIVVGTSMGAILGGLYAAGYSADSVWNVAAEEDWRLLFEPMVYRVGPRRSLRHATLRLQSGTRSPLVARGYSPDWRINRALTRLLFTPSARAHGDFDLLPRRFRAMAADLDTGELVPLRSGDLALAIRASMSVAGFFPPVTIDERRLFDGGIADYLPVEEARRLGATRVVAVDVVRPTPRAHSLDALYLARRSVELMSVKVRQGEPDLLIVPKLDPAQSSVEYPVDPLHILETGLQAVLDTLPAVEREHEPREAGPLPGTTPGVVMKTHGFLLEPFMRRAFEPLAGQPFDASRVFEMTDRLYATGLFDAVWPSIEAPPVEHASAGEAVATTDSLAPAVTATDVAPSLVIRADERGSATMLAGLGYDNDRGGKIWSSFRSLHMSNEWPIEFALEGSVDGVDAWGAATGRIASLRPHVSAWTAGVSYGESEVRFLELGTDEGDPEVSRFGAWLGAEWQRIDRGIQASTGIRVEQIELEGEGGGSAGPWFQIGGTPRLVREVGNDPSIEADLRFGTIDYWTLRAKGSHTRRLGPAIAAVLADVTGVSEESPPDVIPAMGDEWLMPALRWGERRGRVRAVAGLDAAHGGPLGSSVRLRLRGGAIVDELRSDTAAYSGETKWIGGAGVSLLWWTFLGRVEVGAEAGTEGDKRLIVALGPDF